MHQLPVVILSKELKYSLATEKVKTLQKAVQLLPRLQQTDKAKAQKIVELNTKYQAFEDLVKEQVEMMNKVGLVTNLKGQQQKGSKIQVTLPMNQILIESAIVQIAGGKGSGKTCLLLYFAEQFIQMHSSSNQKISLLILNCTTGITSRRVSKLHKLIEENKVKLQYYDIGTAEDACMIVEQYVKNIEDEANKNQKVIIIMDSLVTLLLSREKSKPIISRLMKSFKSISAQCLCVALFSNFIQHKFEVPHEEVYNHASYHAQITGEYLTNKFYCEKDKNGKFKVVSVKGKKYQTLFSIDEMGVSEVISPPLSMQL